MSKTETFTREEMEERAEKMRESLPETYNQNLETDASGFVTCKRDVLIDDVVVDVANQKLIASGIAQDGSEDFVRFEFPMKK